jgi:hypothetical protein
LVGHLACLADAAPLSAQLELDAVLPSGRFVIPRRVGAA